METFKVKFVTSEPDVEIRGNPTDTIASIVDQIKQQKGIAINKHLRVICAGMELYPDDTLSKAPAKVLHCMVTDLPPVRPTQPRVSHQPASPTQPQPAQLQPPPTDWLDVVDPGTVLMWIFGSILTLLWLLFFFYAHLFDRTSVIMLLMMTVAFLIPCVLSYIPWPTLLHPQRRALTPQGAIPYDYASGRSTAVQQGQAWQRHMGDAIPPRPRAQVQPGS